MNSRVGLLRRLRNRLFGERDPIEQQLKEISRQGAPMARMAHACAFALIFLFSLGSLVALGGDALNSIITGWRLGQVDIPSAISVGVSTLLVACMDVGMVYAASMLRRLAARRAPASEKRLHQLVMGVVAILEASTYAYMSARYEHPANLWVWALILARAAAAPLLSVYLSMARTIPVSSRDILYQAELITGVGVLRHVTMLANNSETRPAELLAMYHAAGEHSESERNRLVHLIQVAQLGEEREREEAFTPFDDGAGPTFPTGGGSPAQVRIVPSLDNEEDEARVEAMDDLDDEPLAPAAQGSMPSGPREARKRVSEVTRQAAAFEWLRSNPGMNATQLQRVLNCRWKTADRYVRAYRRQGLQRRVQ